MDQRIVGAVHLTDERIAWTGCTGEAHSLRVLRGSRFIGRWEYRYGGDGTPGGLEFKITPESEFASAEAVEAAIDGWDEWCRVYAFDLIDAEQNYDRAHDQWRAAQDADQI